MRIVTPGFHEESFAKSAFRGPYRKHLMPNQGKHYIPTGITSGAGCTHIQESGSPPVSRAPTPRTPTPFVLAGRRPTYFVWIVTAPQVIDSQATRSKPSRWRFRFMLS